MATAAVMSDTILPGRMTKRSIEIRSRLLTPAFGEYGLLPLGTPSNLDLAGAAPLLCAGITTYSPMRHWGVTKGKKVGVVGLGGLGHMAVKVAHALGAHVVVFTTIGGIAETQEMLDFCGTHHITADVEVIPIQKVNEAYDRLLKSDVKYRFSIDMASLTST